MAILRKAISLFREEKYNQALQLFLEAGEIYGRSLVDFNIRECKKKIEKSNGGEVGGGELPSGEVVSKNIDSKSNFKESFSFELAQAGNVEVARRYRAFVESGMSDRSDKRILLRLIFGDFDCMPLSCAWREVLRIVCRQDRYDDLLIYVMGRLNGRSIEELGPIFFDFYEMAHFLHNEQAINFAESFLDWAASERSNEIRVRLAAKILPLDVCYKRNGAASGLMSRLGVEPREVFGDDHFIHSFVAQPLAFCDILPSYFEEIINSKINEYYGIFAKFIYDVTFSKQLSGDTALMFFNLKEKYKSRLIMRLRRLDLKSVFEMDWAGVDQVVGKIKTETDVLFLCMLGLSDRLPLIELSRKLKLQDDSCALLFASSRSGDNSRLIDWFNAGYRGLQLSEIHAVGEVRTLKNMYEAVLSRSAKYKSDLQCTCDGVSVIMTTFNPDVSLMELAIDSVVRQDGVEVELILVDDGSDNSKEIKETIKKYNCVRYLRNVENSGVYESRNSAISIAKFDIVAFQDDDDVSHPDRLKYQIGRMRETNAKVVAVSHVRFDDNARVQIDSGGEIKSDGPVTMLFNKDILRVVGGFASVRSGGDVEFRSRVVRTFGHGAYVKDDVPLYFSRGDMGTLSSMFEYGINYPRLALQRRLIEVKNDAQ